MFKKHLVLLLLAITLPIHAQATDRYGLGRTPTAEEIKQWDIDIMPDGKQLPSGSGTVDEGRLVYQEKCLSCHGEEGQGGVNDKLVGIDQPETDFATDMQVVRTIGNYWPYATTLYDYIYRAMPHTSPGSLETDEVYSLVAYLLYLNGIIDKEKEMNPATLPEVQMPANHRFYWSDEVSKE